MNSFEKHATSSHSGTFYFAYGSNLSPEQMSIRCKNSAGSSVPLAIVRLDGWKWIITDRGYANIVELPTDGSTIDGSKPPDVQTTVWGVVYNISPLDEATLDLYEGCSLSRNPHLTPNPDPKTAERRPYLQPTEWDYNKNYLPVVVEKWLQPASSVMEVGEQLTKDEEERTKIIKVLVYVDEERTQEGDISFPYIGRMNRAIRQSVQLGVPLAWVDGVIRRWVPAGIEVETGYVGNPTGYVKRGLDS